MKITFSDDAPQAIAADVLAIAVQEGAIGDDRIAKALDQRLHGLLTALAAADEFTGKADQQLSVTPGRSLAARRLLLVGLGKPKAIGRAEARAFAVRAARCAGTEKLALVAPSGDADVYQGIAEGVELGAYRYTRYLTGDRKPKRELASAVVVAHERSGKPGAAQRKAIESGRIVAEAVNWTRDWVNGPPNDVNPVSLANAAKGLASEAGIEAKILDKAAITRRGMNLLLAVNMGSAVEPRLVHLKYAPRGAKGRVVFVGKGITFDSGGLCLKTAKQMGDMKCDMAGAALTIATVTAAARLGLPVEVHGIAVLTENMTGPNAYRPGDVYTSFDGKSVEIINTDAEGRLVLADALAYAREVKPDVLVDHATLTGACMVALGAYTAGLYANDDRLAQRYLDAGTRAGESAWRLPLLEELRESLKSDVADLKHTGEQYGGSISAALFLREFIGDCKWVHMDIAGPAYLERAQGIMPKGATGFGVLTALRFLEDYAKA